MFFLTWHLWKLWNTNEIHNNWLWCVWALSEARHGANCVNPKFLKVQWGQNQLGIHSSFDDTSRHSRKIHSPFSLPLATLKGVKFVEAIWFISTESVNRSFQRSSQQRESADKIKQKCCYETQHTILIGPNPCTPVSPAERTITAVV